MNDNENQNEILNENKNDDFKQYDSYIDIKAIGNLREQGKYEEVYNLVKEKYDLFPDSHFLTFQYTISLIDYKPYASEEILEMANRLVLCKNGEDSHFAYVIYYLSVGNPDEAAKEYKFLHSKYLLKMVNFKINQYKKSSKVFRKLTFDPDKTIKTIEHPDVTINVYVHKTFDLAEYYRENKDVNNAIKYYKLSLEKRRRDQQALCYLGIAKCYFILSNYDEFKSNFKTCLEISKEVSDEVYYKALYQYIYCLNDFYQFEEAYNLTKELDKGSKKDKNMSLYLKGKILKNAGEYEKSVQVFEKLLNKDEEDRKHALSELSKVYVLLGDIDKGKYYLDMLYDEYPDNSPVLKMSFLYDSMQNEECIDFAKKYVDSRFINEAKYYIGRSLCRLRRYDEAETYLESIKTKVTKTPLYYELALTNDRIGNYDKAFEYYTTFINTCYKRHDKRLLEKGLWTFIDFCNNQYDFENAYTFIDFYQKIYPENVDKINLLNASHYFRKQDYENAIEYFKKLYGTELENEAKNYLVVIYRYLNDIDNANLLLDELENTEYRDESIINKAKQLKDKHTKRSLNDAFNYLNTIQNEDIKTMIVVEKIQILIKLQKYDVAEILLEKTMSEHSISKPEYIKYKNYILCKKGMPYNINLQERDFFMNYAIDYNASIAIDNIIRLNNYNRGVTYDLADANDYDKASKMLYLTDSELEALFCKLNGKLDGYNYYVHELYDVYIINMGEVIGQFYGIDTSYIEVRCEQNTQNIHMIQPTLKKLNVTKFNKNTRKRKNDKDKN